MIREITGMLVIAIAIENTSTNDVVFPLGPHRLFWSISCEIPNPATNGMHMPAAKTAPTVRRSPRRNTVRSSDPAMNSSSSRPS